eukprot:666430-Alexandrium_andersonii.AAC.1
MNVLYFMLCPFECRAKAWVFRDFTKKPHVLACEPFQRYVAARRLRWLAATPRRCRRYLCLLLLYMIRALRAAI